MTKLYKSAVCDIHKNYSTECDCQVIQPKDRLEYLRGELEAECMSYGELAELQSLAEYIEPGDVQLLEASGVPEFAE